MEFSESGEHQQIRQMAASAGSFTGPAWLVKLLIGLVALLAAVAVFVLFFWPSLEINADEPGLYAGKIRAEPIPESGWTRSSSFVDILVGVGVPSAQASNGRLTLQMVSKTAVERFDPSQVSYTPLVPYGGPWAHKWPLVQGDEWQHPQVSDDTKGSKLELYFENMSGPTLVKANGEQLYLVYF